MDRDPPNPYIDGTLREIWTALNNRAGQLLQNKPAGRRDTAYLLLAAASRISPIGTGPSAPEKLVASGSGVTEAFMPAYLQDAQAARYRILQQAIDAAGLQWDTHKIFCEQAGQIAIRLAQRDEDGLREALALIDQARLDPR